MLSRAGVILIYWCCFRVVSLASPYISCLCTALLIPSAAAVHLQWENSNVSSAFGCYPNRLFCCGDQDVPCQILSWKCLTHATAPLQATHTACSRTRRSSYLQGLPNKPDQVMWPHCRPRAAVTATSWRWFLPGSQGRCLLWMSCTAPAPCTGRRCVATGARRTCCWPSRPMSWCGLTALFAPCWCDIAEVAVRAGCYACERWGCAECIRSLLHPASPEFPKCINSSGHVEGGFYQKVASKTRRLLMEGCFRRL